MLNARETSLTEVARLLGAELRSELGTAVSLEVKNGMKEVLKVATEMAKSAAATAKALDRLSSIYLFLKCPPFYKLLRIQEKKQIIPPLSDRCSGPRNSVTANNMTNKKPYYPWFFLRENGGNVK
jgi:hypothetical protein